MNIEVKWNSSAKKKLEERPGEMIHEVAKLMIKASQQITPKRTGKLRRSAISYGVKGQGLRYQIANTTSYAADTYKGLYNGYEIRNWTTPGTGANWYGKTWRNNGVRIVKYAVKKWSLK